MPTPIRPPCKGLVSPAKQANVIYRDNTTASLIDVYSTRTWARRLLRRDLPDGIASPPPKAGTSGDFGWGPFNQHGHRQSEMAMTWPTESIGGPKIPVNPGITLANRSDKLTSQPG